MKNNMITRLAITYVQSYRKKAELSYVNGMRPYYLPCETEMEGHCAQFFEEDLRVYGLYQAVIRFMRRCPKGRVGATLGLVSGLMILGGFSAFRATESSTEKDCNECGDGTMQICKGMDECSQAGMACGRACSL